MRRLVDLTGAPSTNRLSSFRWLVPLPGHLFGESARGKSAPPSMTQTWCLDRRIPAEPILPGGSDVTTVHVRRSDGLPGGSDVTTVHVRRRDGLPAGSRRHNGSCAPFGRLAGRIRRHNGS
jgi:hypothetical protein